MIVHQVWATESKKTKSKLIAEYEEEKWQWAMKLRSLLIEEGYKDVKITNKAKLEVKNQCLVR